MKSFQYADGERHVHCNKKGEFDCGDDFSCIHESWVCDKEKDCPNGADELPKVCHNFTCRPDQFQCQHIRNCISGNLKENLIKTFFCKFIYIYSIQIYQIYKIYIKYIRYI